MLLKIIFIKIITTLDISEPSVELFANNFLDTNNGIKPKNSLEIIESTMINDFNSSSLVMLIKLTIDTLTKS